MVIAIVVILNLAVGLPSNVQKDLSSEKIYTVSDTSREILSNLDANVEVIVLAPTDGVDQRISTYLTSTAACPTRSPLKDIDTTLYPSALSEYDTDSSSVVVVPTPTPVSSRSSPLTTFWSWICTPTTITARSPTPTLTPRASSPAPSIW